MGIRILRTDLEPCETFFMFLMNHFRELVYIGRRKRNQHCSSSHPPRPVWILRRVSFVTSGTPTSYRWSSTKSLSLWRAHTSDPASLTIPKAEMVDETRMRW
jgi:hypothetical protein